jgi:aminoglycoside phosphotransferase (APT) family kinase protein
MRTLDHRFGGTRPLDERFRFDVSALELWMREHVENFSPGLTVSQFRGGQSNPTYLLSAGMHRWVLRRKPPGKLLTSAHAVDREYRVLAALADSDVPVARVHGLCSDETVIGTSFYVMDYVEGRIFWDPSLPGVAPGERASIFMEMNRVLAALHAIDPEAHGLADFGRPGNYFARQIERWSRQYRSGPAGRIDAMDRVIEWLAQRIPASDEVSVVHGDFRMDNLIFHPGAPRIVAVLDWELSTLGHPLADLAYHCLPWHLPTDDERSVMRVTGVPEGIPTEDEYVQAYCRLMGRPNVEYSEWAFCVAFSFFRVAAILHGISGRVAEGNAASAQANEMARTAPLMASLAWRAAQRDGARASCLT